MRVLKLGLIRGFVGMAVGMAVAIGGVYVLGKVAGHDWFEMGLVLSCIFGTVGFMLGVGAMSDWLKWANGEYTPMVHGGKPGDPQWVRYFNTDYSHKVIGIQYTVTSIIVLLIGGTLALIMRTELAEPGMQFVTADNYMTLVGMHGIVMIGAILIGVGGMANYLVPLMIGASDMAFPRLNAFAYWINVPGVVLLVISMLYPGGWDTGWTGYPPLGAHAGPGIDFFYMGVYMIGLSSILGAINIIVTTVRMRMPGMNYFRMPIFVWAVFATVLIALTATQLIGLSFLMVVAERTLHLGFFDPNLSAAAIELGSPPGDVVLFQHLFWFYSHPAVYVFILPGLGVISELLPVFSRKPLFGYKWVALSSMAIALVGFLVWAHHMFVAGIAQWLIIPFMWTTLFVAIPTGVKFFSWMGTLWRGQLTFPTPMLFTLGAIMVFLLGGLTGPPLGMTVTDMFLHDSYYVVGHFHATMFGGFTFAFFAAVYYWFPKATGHMFNERLGKIHFWLMFPAFYVMSLSQMWAGLHGMRRRIADYDPALHLEPAHLLITAAGFTIGFSVLLMVINLVRSARKGAPAPDNPWNSRSPEFMIPSPPPEHSYHLQPRVVGEPYDYGLPGSVYVVMEEATHA